MISKKYFEVGIGRVPIVLSCPHGGFKNPKDIPDRSKGIRIPDRITYLIAKSIIQNLEARDIEIYYILSKISRGKIDLNRPPRSFVAFDQSSDKAREIHLKYHNLIQEFAQKCVLIHNKCLFIDLHGFSKPHSEYPDIIFGNIFGNSLVIKQDSAGYWGYSHIKDELTKHFKIDDGLGFSDFNLAYSGGYITHQFYKRENINAFQLEIEKKIRLDVKKTRLLIDSIIAGIIKTLDI